ncbi:MAG: nucleoside monophosphate kinase [Candidatus Babeliales bacterium]
MKGFYQQVDLKVDRGFILHLEEKIFIFIGPPGAGKGSLSTLCTQEFGWKQLSTGNLCRRHIAKETSIGKKIDFTIKSGKLIADELITRMIIDWFMNFSANGNTTILDGYPRTIGQARSFGNFIRKTFVDSQLKIVKLLIPDDVVIKRLGRRYVCQNSDCQAIYSLKPGSINHSKKSFTCDYCTSSLGRRDDDKEKTVRERLKTYYKFEDELLNFYQHEGRAIKKVNVDKPLNKVFEDFKTLIASKIV